jgi:lauroyl/myristoyl acyltransferase
MNEERRRQVARKSVQVFARTFLELFWSPRLNRKNIEKFVSFENPDAFQAILATKLESPTIGITPHFGNFEWGSALFALRDYDGYILTQKFKNDRLTPIFRKIREMSGHQRLLDAINRTALHGFTRIQHSFTDRCIWPS